LEDKLKAKFLNSTI